MPYRDEAYREDTSLVGYYNGFNPASVDTVILPQDEDRIEFNELALKNDETLDLVLSAYCGDEQITGSGKYKVHYTASIYDNDKSEKLADLVISEAALTKGMPTSGALVDYFNNLHISDTSSFTDGATDTKNIGGVKEMKKLPDMIFVVDPRKEHICIQEAQTLGIPLVGIADTNCDPEELDYVIPGNDDAIRAVKLIVSKLADAVIEANQGADATAAEEEAVEAEAAATEE